MKQLLLVLGLISAAICLQPGYRRRTRRRKPLRRPPSGGPAASPRVQVVTSMGNFTIELNAERAPLTVAHFLKYVDQGHYTGTIFHRVIPNFVIQGGGFDSNYKLGAGPYQGGQRVGQRVDQSARHGRHGAQPRIRTAATRNST